MIRLFPISILCIGQMLILLSFAQIAFGIIGNTEIAAIKQEMKTASTMKFKGALSCNLGSANNGQGCALTLMEPEMGKIFKISESARELMRAFQDGARNVAIEGTLSGANTIQVRSYEIL